MCESFAILYVDAFWPLNEYKVLNGLLIERRKVEIDRGRKISSPDREVRPCEVWAAAKCSEQVIDQREMQHFFHGYSAYRGTPATNGFQLLLADALILTFLQSPLGIQISAHHHVLEFRRLGEQVEKLFTVVNGYAGSVHGCKAL